MIEYLKFGKAPYKIVLIHGFPSNYTVWDNIIPALAEVSGGIAVNMPGIGNSPAVAELSLDCIADSILEVIAYEGMERVHLVGHSMGGYTALSLMKKFNNVAGLTLVHSGANADSEERRKNRIKSIALMEKGEREVKVFITAMFKNFFSRRFTLAHPEIINKYIQIGTDIPASVVIGLFRSILDRSDSFDLIRSAGIPVQYILGTEDTATPLKEILPQAALPAACLVNIYTGCGHGAFEEMPQQLAADIVKFHNYIHG